MSCTIRGSEIALTGSIGFDGMYETDEVFTPADVRSALSSVGRQTRAIVRLNSGGGVSSDGVAIASMFSAHPGGVEVIVEGVAADAASVAACGARRVTMALGAVMMIGEAGAFTIGTVDEQRAALAELKAINTGFANVFARKTGRSLKAMAELMAEETWLDANAAVAAGFADGIEGEDAAPPAPFAYARYRNAPATLLRRPVAAAEAASGRPELRLHGRVGHSDKGPFFTAATVAEDLRKLRGKGLVAVSLNSTGGNTVEGVAISAALNAHPDGVEVIVEGVALSAAAAIACAAPRSAISPGSTMMLHQGSIDGKTAASASGINKAVLEAQDASNADLLARKSGMPVADVRKLLEAETWFTAEQAVAAGFIDRMVGAAAPIVADLSGPADPAEIAELCAAAEQHELTAVLIRERASIAQATARLDVVGSIRPMMALCAGHPGITPELNARMLSGSVSVPEARDAILTAMAEADAEIVIDTSKRTGNGSPTPRTASRRNMEQLAAKMFGPAALKTTQK